MTNCKRLSGVCLPFCGDVISIEGPLCRDGDGDVMTRGRGVVFLLGGDVEVVFGNKENPPEGAPLDDGMVARLVLFPLLCQTEDTLTQPPFFSLLPFFQFLSAVGSGTQTIEYSSRAESRRVDAGPATGTWSRDPSKGHLLGYMTEIYTGCLTTH